MSPFNNNSHSCNTRQRSFRRRLFAVPLVGALTIGALMGTADATAAPSTGSSGSSSGSSGSSTGSADLLGGLVDLVIGSSGESTGSESTGSADGSLGSAEIGTPEQRSTRASRYLFADPADRYIVVLGAKIGTLAGLDGLPLSGRFDRDAEEGAITAFRYSLQDASAGYLADPAGAPRVPSWARVQSALPHFLRDLESVVHDTDFAKARPRVHVAIASSSPVVTMPVPLLASSAAV